MQLSQSLPLDPQMEADRTKVISQSPCPLCQAHLACLPVQTLVPGWYSVVEPIADSRLCGQCGRT